MESRPFNDQRRSFRTRDAKLIHYALASEEYQLEHLAITINHSRDGVRIQTAKPLRAGERAIVFLQPGSRHPVPSRIVWVREGISSVGPIAGLQLLYSLPT